MIVTLDFDGTVVDHAYPDIGADLGAAPWLRQLVYSYDATLILWTLRDGEELAAAARYLADHGVAIKAANALPGQREWSMSPKVHRDLYIGDDALGIPTRIGAAERPVVDWARAGTLAIEWATQWRARQRYYTICNSKRYTGRSDT